MDRQLASEILSGDSDELLDLKNNLPILDGFIQLIQKLDSMPDISKRFWEESRSLYQATCKNREMSALESLLTDFFGPPVKPADKPLPRKFNKEPTIKYLGGIQKEQSLFLLRLKTGTFYGALWPWRRNQSKIEAHLGYCSDWMVDEDYQKLEILINRSVSQNAFAQMDTQIGGQIRGISLASFLQMAEMEQSSFSLRIAANGRNGILHVVQGKLLSARTDQCIGREAAYQIISWDDAVIEITPIAGDVNDDIQQPLMHVLMESLRKKDEITTSDDAPSPPPLLKPTAARSKSAVRRGKPLVRLERVPPPPRPSRKKSYFLLVFVISLTVIAIIGAGVLFTLHPIRTSRDAFEYTEFIKRLETALGLEKKQAMLKNLFSGHLNTPHPDGIEKRIQINQRAYEVRDFELTTLKINTLPIDEHYEETAIFLYSDFQAKYPDSHYDKQISKSIREIKSLLDQYYYDELKQPTGLNLDKRLDIYRNYLRRFPEGRDTEDILVLIHEIGIKHFAFLKSQEEQCIKNQHMEPCIQYYQDFVDIFAETDLALEAEEHRSVLVDRQHLVNLKKAVVQVGNDYQQAAKLYADYLAQNPHTSQKQVIENDLAELQKPIASQRQWLAVRSFAINPGNNLLERVQRLDNYLRRNSAGPFSGEAQKLMNRLETQLQAAELQQRRKAQEKEVQERLQTEKKIAAQRQQQMAQTSTRVTTELAGSPRFRSNGDGTVTDLSTGAMWSLLDSNQELNSCISYEAAKSYVKNLRLGGYRDWRLPSANELAALYKKTPFFPAGKAPWYWTAEAYAKGFHTVVTVVTSKAETVFERENRTDDQCGAVRAIRP